MRLPATALILFTIILIIFTSVPQQKSTGFKSLADDEDKSCIEVVVCHDISEYRRTTQGDAYPYEHCICHSEIPDPGTLIEVKGPRTVEPTEVVMYSVIIHGGDGISYGFAVNATNGTVNKNYQFSPLDKNVIEIEYTAPDTEQTVQITFVGLSSDGDLEVKPEGNDTAGDTWNLNRITVEIKEHTADSDGGSTPLLVITLILVAVVVFVIILIKINSGKSKGK
jgi:hypothetical protein